MVLTSRCCFRLSLRTASISVLSVPEVVYRVAERAGRVTPEEVDAHTRECRDSAALATPGLRLAAAGRMRPPRHRFSNDVRATTRAIASRIGESGEVASAAQLEAWIARNDDVRERLTRQGYGTAFNAEDLFPLFEALVAKASGGVPRGAPKGSPRSGTWLRWVILAVLAIAVVVVVVLAAR